MQPYGEAALSAFSTEAKSWFYKKEQFYSSKLGDRYIIGRRQFLKLDFNKLKPVLVNHSNYSVTYRIADWLRPKTHAVLF